MIPKCIDLHWLVAATDEVCNRDARGNPPGSRFAQIIGFYNSQFTFYLSMPKNFVQYKIISASFSDSEMAIVVGIIDNHLALVRYEHLLC